LVERALSGDKEAPQEIDSLIYSLYQLDSEEIMLVRNV